MMPAIRHAMRGADAIAITIGRSPPGRRAYSLFILILTLLSVRGFAAVRGKTERPPEHTPSCRRSRRLRRSSHSFPVRDEPAFVIRRAIPRSQNDTTPRELRQR